MLALLIKENKSSLIVNNGNSHLLASERKYAPTD
jgi:hypothetical protein